MLAQPRWTRLGFAFLAIALLLLVATAARTPAVQGTWSTTQVYRGEAAPQAATWPLGLRLPASVAGDGLAVRVSPATVVLRPLGPLDAPWFAAALVDAAGQVRLQAVLDPANPQNAPHGPPTAYVPAGDYEVSVASGEANRSVPFALEVTVFFPYAAAVEGWAVAPLGLLLPVLPAAAWALWPPPGLVARLRRGRRPPPAG